jgi:hypothetical protein
VENRKHAKAFFDLLPGLDERIGDRILTADEPAFAMAMAWQAQIRIGF